MIHWEESTIETVMLTPSEASDIVKIQRYADQRAVDWGYVRQYAMAIQGQRFRPCSVITYALLDGEEILVNGQHTLEGIILAQKPYPVRKEVFPVDTQEDVGLLYGTFDQHRRRSSGDIFQAYRLDVQTQMGKTHNKWLSAAMPLVMSGFTPWPTQARGFGLFMRDQWLRAQCVKSWAPEAQTYFELVRNCPQEISNGMHRAAVIAVAVVTLRHTGTDAEEFWHNAAMGDGLDRGDPQLTLHQFLREKSAKAFVAHVYARYVASAWSGAFEGRKMVRLRPWPESAEQPIHIAGTPHDGKKVMRYLSEDGAVGELPHEYTPGGSPLPHTRDAA